MSVPSDTIWRLAPHTKAKHEILRRYLDRWFPILTLGGFGKVVYIDGFSGPGVYERGEPGSPIIALESALTHFKNGAIPGDKKVIFGFIEEREDRVEMLRRLVSEKDLPENFEVIVEAGNFDGHLSESLNDLRSRGAKIAPTFAFVDPFGTSGVPMELLHRLLAYPHTEVFTNFPVNSANRQKQHPNEAVVGHVEELLGQEVPPELPADVSGVDWIRGAYQDRLSEAAEYVRSFEMYGPDSQPVYDLFFAGNHDLGHEKMKEAMWAVDPDGDFRFSDASDEAQLVMFDVNPVPQLLDQICERYRHQDRQIVREILDWARGATPFLETHVKRALKNGETQGKYTVKKWKADGSKRSHGFTQEVLIDFTTPVPQQGMLF